MAFTMKEYFAQPFRRPITDLVGETISQVKLDRKGDYRLYNAQGEFFALIRSDGILDHMGMLFEDGEAPEDTQS